MTIGYEMKIKPELYLLLNQDHNLNVSSFEHL